MDIYPEYRHFSKWIRENFSFSSDIMQTLHVTYGYNFYHWKLKFKFSLHIHTYINNVINNVKNNIKTTLLHVTVSVHEKISYHIHTNLFRKCIPLLVEKCVIWNCNFWYENFETVLLIFTRLTLFGLG